MSDDVLNVKHLLWVDDDGEMRFKFESKKLMKLGYTIQWAQTGKQAFELLREQAFDVVILDQQLPWEENTYPSVWGGVLLLAWCRAEERPGAAPAIHSWDPLFESSDRLEEAITSKILVVSAFYDAQVAEVREALGVTDKDTLSKPVDFPMLLARINGS